MSAWVLADHIFFSVTDQSLIALDGSRIVHLSIREVLLLDALLRNETDKRRLIDIVWPNTIVSDSSYHKLLFELRANLQLMGLPSTVIKTIPRRGCAINISAVATDEVELNVLMSPSETRAESDIYEKIAETNNYSLLPEEIALLTSVTPESIREIEKCHSFDNVWSRYSNIFVREKFIAFSCAISLSLSTIIFYMMTVFSEISIYKVNVVEKDKKIFALNKEAFLWDEDFFNKKFSVGFHYVYGNESLYFLCKKELGKCENHMFFLH